LPSPSPEAFRVAALLRSMAVLPSGRSGGNGARLLAWLGACVRERGVVELVLLTKTAERFFLGRGYRPSKRVVVSAAVGASAEFCALCSASACCMVKALKAASV
jgi:N-acetylglutamate synthase-like GNAT family acetyltransferase